MTKPETARVPCPIVGRSSYPASVGRGTRGRTSRARCLGPAARRVVPSASEIPFLGPGWGAVALSHEDGFSDYGLGLAMKAKRKG